MPDRTERQSTYTVHVGFNQCFAVETDPIEATSIDEAIEKAVEWCENGGWDGQKSCGDPGNTYIIAISEDEDDAWADDDCQKNVPEKWTEEDIYLIPAQRAAVSMLEALKELREWAANMGGWEAPCWAQAGDAIAEAEG